MSKIEKLPTFHNATQSKSKRTEIEKKKLTKNPMIQDPISYVIFCEGPRHVLIAFLGVSQRGEPKSKNLFLAIFELPVPRNICLARW
jgi:hypothetical protein